jgi:hypothetical protein
MERLGTWWWCAAVVLMVSATQAVVKERAGTRDASPSSRRSDRLVWCGLVVQQRSYGSPERLSTRTRTMAVRLSLW